MQIEFEILIPQFMEEAFSAGWWNHCCVMHGGYGQDEY